MLLALIQPHVDHGPHRNGGLALKKLHKKLLSCSSLPAAFITITFLHITVGEQAPKMIAIQREQATALAVSLPLLVFYHVFRPFIWFIDGASRLILRGLGFGSVDEHRERFTADELRLMVAETIAGGELSRVERQVMKGVLEFEDKTARQIMVPRPDIVFLDTRDSFRENVAAALESGKTRFPLCAGNLDHVVGMVHSRDLLRALAEGAKDVSVESLKREVPFLPETLGLNDLLLRFQKKRTHMAVLLDENLKELKRIPVSELAQELENFKDHVKYVVFDGIITQRLIDVLSQRSDVVYLVGVRVGEISKPADNVKTLTFNHL